MLPSDGSLPTMKCNTMTVSTGGPQRGLRESEDFVGTFNWPIRLDSPDGERSLQLDALVDTGSFYTIVPTSLLRSLETVPTEKVGLELADGRRVVWDIGEVRATIDGRSVTTLVAFGEDAVEPVLGAYTLEGLRLSVDPVEETLVPIPYARA